MTAPAPDERQAQASSMLRCAACDAPLAHDQRYCVKCGVRRGPVPRGVAELIGSIREQGRSTIEPTSGPAGRLGAADGTRPRSIDTWMPGARSAAIAVMAMLAFGVAIGATVGGGVSTLVSAPLLLIAPRHSSSTPASNGGSIAGSLGASPPAASLGGSSGGSSGGASGASSGGGAGSSSTAATATQTTVTITETSSGEGNNGGSNGGNNGGGGSSNLYGLPPIKHVFMIVLTDHGYSQTFGSTDRYLSTTLPRQGKLIDYYYAVAGGPLANEIALLSGQGPTKDTVADCPRFANIVPGGKGTEGQVIGNGCVYPARTKTLAGQLTAAHYTGKAYVQGIGTPGQPQGCAHPALGSSGKYQTPSARHPYVAWRNPFVYFHSLIDAKACRSDDVGLGQLAKDLKTESATPNLAYIVADPCDDGSDQPCAPHAEAGLGPADRFLRSVVPEIQRSPAFKANGLIAITFDQAPQTGPHADPSACCDNPTYPNVPATTPTAPTSTTPTSSSTTTTGATPTGASPAGSSTTTNATTGATPSTGSTVPTSTGTSPTTTTPTTATGTTTTSTTSTTTTPLGLSSGQTTPTGGGGQVGLLLISPYIKRNTVDVLDYYDHFSLLASIEDIFGLRHLGYAGNPQLPVFDVSVFDAYSG